MEYYLAIDVGASSGRHILGHIENNKLHLEEIYRFKNEIINDKKSLCWDIDNLLKEVKTGLSMCKKTNKIPKTIAIDTWGVDYILLDKNKKEIKPFYCYRDNRTDAFIDEVNSIISQKELYKLTGIQMQKFNTIYQLYCDKKSGKLNLANYFLMIPDYLSFKLTGIINNEYTNGSTTNLVNAKSKMWDDTILSKLNIPKHIFSSLTYPTNSIGNFSEEIIKELGFNSKVICCPSHDTASAVAACPLDNETVYISSGTWSLIGTECFEPQLSTKALEKNFTNEGGIEFRFRFLKNIMGMWIFQNIRKDINYELSYDEMMKLAMNSTFKTPIDLNNSLFTKPNNMVEAIRKYLNIPDLPLSDILSSCYHSLAISYKKAIDEIENITHKRIKKIYIVGGGSRDNYLNQLTANYTKKQVLIGVQEGTAVGNLISQIIADKNINLEQARQIVKNTFITKEVNYE